MLIKGRAIPTADKARPPRNRAICTHLGHPCKPGHAICATLDAAIAQARPMLDPGFDLRGTVCVDTCERQCLLAFLSTPSATWCIGDVTPDVDLDRLIADPEELSSRPGAVIVSVPCLGPLQ